MIAAIYARKSTEQAGVADDQKSVARQLDHARTYATAKGWMADDRYAYVDSVGRPSVARRSMRPVLDTNEILIEALLDEVLDPSIVWAAVEEAVCLITGRGSDDDPRENLERAIGKAEQERARLVFAIAAGGELAGLLEALKARETTIEGLRSELAVRQTQRRPGRADVATIRAEVLTLADSWRQVLAEDPVNARPIVTSLLVAPVTIAPVEAKRRWMLTGEGTLSGLFQREIFQKVVRPHRDSARRA